MQLTAREAATLLHVDEETVQKRTRKKGLPARKVNERSRLNRVDLSISGGPPSHNYPRQAAAPAGEAGGEVNTRLRFFLYKEDVCIITMFE